MPIDWIWGFVGGLVIGLAGAVFLLMNGKIMGASGIIGGLVDGTGRNTWAERAAFLVGLAGFPALLSLFNGPFVTNVTSNIVILVVAGVFVGFGTRLANGCTSGHGVCGISRLSFRGLIATVIYIAAGGVSILILRHLLGVL